MYTIKPINIKYAIIEESILSLKVICLSEIARLGQMGSVKVRLISFIRVSARLYVGERILMLKLPLASLEIPSRVNDLPRTSMTQRSKVSRTIETRIINYSCFILDNFYYLLTTHLAWQQVFPTIFYLAFGFHGNNYLINIP